MRKAMRMLLSATTVLGLVLFALAVSGISGLTSQLEAATSPPPVPAPATEEFIYESREIDCPLRDRARERPQI